jgi:hypothetical protein
MPKDGQLDPKEVRKQKAKGGPTLAESKTDSGSNTHKTQSARRHKPSASR